jgi:hypothetical protein
VTSLEFAELARRLGAATRREGFEAPSFRSPPRSPSHTRSLARQAAGTVTVSVRLKNRSSLAVAADLIDGVVAANKVDGQAAGLLRDTLWLVTDDLLLPSQSEHSTPVRSLAA